MRLKRGKTSIRCLFDRTGSPLKVRKGGGKLLNRKKSIRCSLQVGLVKGGGVFLLKAEGLGGEDPRLKRPAKFEVREA